MHVGCCASGSSCPPHPTGQVNCNGNKFTVVLRAFGRCGFALCETNNVCWTVFFELVKSTVTAGRVDTGGDF